MLNEFIPAIVSIAVLVCVFLFAFIADMRRIRRYKAASEQVRPKIESISVIHKSRSGWRLRRSRVATRA
ncbi:MAG: hypothetical protein ABSD67_03620 [Terracidiphilus sp.]|jgi:hypothetical protein